LLRGIETGKSFKCDERPPEDGEVGVVKVSAVSWGHYQEQESKTCIDPARVNAALFVTSGDFLFSRANTIELVGACVIAGEVHRRVMLSDKILRLQFADERHKPWALQWLRSHAGRAQIESLSTGNQESMRNIGQDKVRQIEIPLPPKPEQTRIVEKLEELLSDLDAGVAELKAAQKKLAQYRQSLLKAAVEGALTAEWRQQHPPAETGAQLLQRILTERRARWEAKQLAKFKQQGKTPPKDWQKKYPEPVQPDTSDLPDLPQGWVWASLDALLEQIETGKSFKCDERPPEDHEVGVIKVSAVSWGEFDEQESKTCVDALLIKPELFVKPGDFLFSRANTIELVGACVIAGSISKKVMLSDKILRFVFVDPFVKEWVLAVLRSERGRKQIEYLASGNQDSMRNIGHERIRQIAVPLPTTSEMGKCFEMLNTGLRAAATQSLAIDVSLKQSTAQRQNILRAAFSGQLVPQDPADEPASVLLARIRAERAAHETTKKPRGRPAKELT
jgi:type I restriction enzyme S subunit